MQTLKKFVLLVALFVFFFTHSSRLQAATYVTDTGGYAYDQSRAGTNLAAAIALGTVAVVGIIAIAVQNTHDSSSSCHSTSTSTSSYGGCCHN
jgi:uncharacterized membrane protein YjgN (DUF898 family)